MKKTILIIIAVLAGLILINSLLTDRAPKGSENETDKLVVLSTFTIISDMVSEVGGDRIEAISLTKPGAEIHAYQPTPNDLIQASKANIMFENGMNLELWTEKLRASIPDVPIFTVSDGVEINYITEDIYEGKPNPHAWMSPQQGLIYVENIRRELTAADPSNAQYFAANAATYSERIKAVDTRLAKALSVLPANNRVLVTCEGAFSYLTNDYGLEELYLWAINSESQGSPQKIAHVIEEVKAKQIPAVFCESTVEPKVQREVVEATGATLGGVLYVDSLSTIDGPASTYIDLLEHTANTIITGLTGNQ
ncbi:MAG: metal ABC transporter substrate-binding protein [Candidatus Pacebacteria bacterium]|nr:metal ABC transporter substrate-binding protein [Candidatus Paceibacterota bacterium]